MVSPADDDSQSGHRSSDLLFLSAALVGGGLLFLLSRDLAPVTGVLTPDLAGRIGVIMIILGVIGAAVEVGIVLDRAGPPAKRRRGRTAPRDSARGRRSAAAPRRAGRSTDTPPPADRSSPTSPEAPRDVEPGGNGLQAVGYVALSVSDRDRSVDWYADVLGFEEALRHDDEDRRVSVMRFGSGGYSVGLVERTTTRGLPFDPAHQGLDHVAFAVGSREELVHWASRLGAAGVAHSEVTDIPPGAMLHLADPDGITLALFWARAGSPAEPPEG